MSTSKKRVLMVDDDVELCELLTDFLRGAGFDVDVIHSGQGAIELLVAGGDEPDYDAVVLDIMMPEVSGLDVLQKVRRTHDVPIIMLTGRGDDIDRIVGLELGADDYLGKPCNPRELVARLNAVLRRSHSMLSADTSPNSSGTLNCCGIEMNTRTLEARFEGKPLQFTNAEFRTLQVLIKHAGETLSKDYLTEKVLNRRLSAHDRSIDVHISRVRQKLSKYSGRDSLIKSVRGIGYQFLADV